MAEDAPIAAAEDIQPAPPEGSADAAPPAASAKAAEALLPTLSIWPPSQRTRDAVVRRLVQTLAAPSVLSQRYGAVPEPEAERAAAAVEAEAFAAASESAAGASPASVEEGIEVLQAYSKEVSRRLLELAKSRAAAAAPAQEPEDSSATSPPSAEATAPEDESWKCPLACKGPPQCVLGVKRECLGTAPHAVASDVGAKTESGATSCAGAKRCQLNAGPT